MELKFKNRSIEKYKSNPKTFIDKKGKSKPVFTSFKMGAKYKGLCLREYLNGEKYFVIRLRLRGKRKKLIIFPVGKFDPTLSVKTGDVLFGTKECEERLFSIVKTHCDDLGRWKVALIFKTITLRITLVVHQGICIHILIQASLTHLDPLGKSPGRDTSRKK